MSTGLTPGDGVPVRVHTKWSSMTFWIALFSALAAGFLFFGRPLSVENDARGIFRLTDEAFGVGFAFLVVRLLLLGRHKPRLILQPLGLIDHSTGRGLLLWTDFSGASRQGTNLKHIRRPSLVLYANPVVVAKYNQRLSIWRRLWLGPGSPRSIKVRAAALDHSLGWLLREMHQRIADASHVTEGR